MSKFFFDHPQLPLLSDVDISKLPIVKKYEALFDSLDLSAIQDHNDGIGCSGYSRHALIKALVIKEQEQIPSVPKLIWFLQNQPYLSRCGFLAGKERTSKTIQVSVPGCLCRVPLPQISVWLHQISTNNRSATE